MEPPCPLVVTAAAAGLLSSPAASPPPRPAADSNRDEGSGRVVVCDAPGRSAPPRAGSEPARRRYASKVGGGVALSEAWLLDEEAGL